MKKFIIIGFLILILGGITGFFIKKMFPPNNKQLIKNTINTAVNSLEKRNIQTFMKQFSPYYTDSYGNTYESLYFTVKYFLSQLGNIHIKLSQMEIKIPKGHNGKIAYVKFSAYVIISSEGSEVDEQEGRFYIELKKEYFKWKIYKFGKIKLNFQ